MQLSLFSSCNNMQAHPYLPIQPMQPHATPSMFANKAHATPVCSPELEGAAPILPMATGAAVEDVKGTTAGTVASLGTDTR